MAARESRLRKRQGKIIVPLSSVVCADMRKGHFGFAMQSEMTLLHNGMRPLRAGGRTRGGLGRAGTGRGLGGAGRRRRVGAAGGRGRSEAGRGGGGSASGAGIIEGSDLGPAFGALDGGIGGSEAHGGSFRKIVKHSVAHWGEGGSQNRRYMRWRLGARSKRLG